MCIVTCARSQLGGSCYLWGRDSSGVLSLAFSTCAGFDGGHLACFHLWNWKLQSPSSPASGTHASFGGAGQHIYLWDHSPQLHLVPPTALAKAESCGLWLCGLRGSPQQWSFVSLAGLGFSLDFLSCVILAPSEYLHSSQPKSFTWSLTPKAWTLAPSPHLPQQVCKQPLSLQVLVGNDLRSEFSPFWLPGIYCSIQLWGSEALCPVPAREWVSDYVETFPPSQLPPWDAGLCPKSFYFFFLISLTLPHSVEISLHFWKSGIFCQHSGVL